MIDSFATYKRFKNFAVVFVKIRRRMYSVLSRLSVTYQEITCKFVPVYWVQFFPGKCVMHQEKQKYVGPSEEKHFFTSGMFGAQIRPSPLSPGKKPRIFTKLAQRDE